MNPDGASSGSVKVSVIIPVYNADKNLRSCLDDLVRQTLRDIEIICVDDGSEDCSRTILSHYEHRYSNFRVFEQKHGGAALARNLGIAMAKGTYLSLLDSDDRFEPDMLERMYNAAAEKNADIVICSCDGFTDGAGRSVPMTWALDYSLVPAVDPFCVKDVPSKIFSIAYGWAWDKLFRTEFIRGNRIKFQSLAATNDMYFTFTALAEAERITVLRKVLVHQRIGRKDSISSSRYRNTDCFYYALKALRERLTDDGLYELTEQSFKNWAVSLSAWQLNTLMDHPDAFIELYGKLHSVILPDMDIVTDKDVYYLRKNRQAYKQCREIMDCEPQEYLFRRWQSAVGLKQRFMYKRTVEKDGMSAMTPVLSYAARRFRSFTECLHDLGIGYTIKLLFGMRFGKRK